MDNETLASAIRSSSGLSQTIQLHRRLEGLRLAKDTYLNNLLIEAYGKCGHPDLSRQVFDSLPFPNCFSWNLLIAAYARNGLVHKAREIFAAMAPRSLVAGNVMINAYARRGHVVDAKDVYHSMPEHSSVSWSSMATTLIASADLDQAYDFLMLLPERDIVCSNLMIAAYAREGQLLQAKHLFDETPRRDVATCNTMLEALGDNGKVTEMQELFDSMPGWSAASLTILVTALARHGRFKEARVAFEARPQLHDLVSWTAMLAGLALHGKDETKECETIFFHKMPLHNHVAWTVMLSAYARVTHLWPRASNFFHQEMPQHSVPASNTVMAMYVQAGKPEQARSVSDEMGHRDVETMDLLLRAGRDEEVEKRFERMAEHTPFSWATRITAAVRTGRLEQALLILDKLPLACHDHLESWTTLAKCFSDHGHFEAAKTIFETRMPVHDRVSSTVALLACVRNGHAVAAREMLQSLPDRDNASWNSLLNVKVADDSDVQRQWRVFQTMPARDVVSWTSVLTSYAHAGRAEDALRLYRCMNLEGERINRVTLVAAIDACAGAAAIADGQSIHYQYAANDHCDDHPDDADVRVENSLLSMYGRCGRLAQAMAVFVEMKNRRDLVSWNTMITLYAQGQDPSHTCAALETFQRMNQRGVDPNDITFTALLCACSRSGCLDIAWSLFHSMTTDYDLAPSMRHRVCMVDLLGRAGKLDEAEKAIQGTSLVEVGIAWRTLLAASEVHASASTGARAANEAASSPSSSTSPAYVLLSNLLTTS